MDSILEGATDAQRAAITHLEGPLLVLAGPGSGKTRVVTRRIAWLVEQGVPPDTILAVTFTNKAAGEMKERVEALLGIRGLWVSTFHSMGARILRRDAERIGYERSFTIFSDDDQKRLCRDILRDLGFDTTRFRPSAVSATISRLKIDLVRPENAGAHVKDYFGEVVAKAYGPYERRLREANALDFDDLLVKTLELLDEDEEVRGHYQRRFQFVLVDEYQDTNRVQYLLMRRLASPRKNLHATGDPDQSIYRFRGADIRNILDFERDYADAKVVRLEENFRSTAHILRGADTLIRNNAGRREKGLVGTLGDGQRIRVHAALDESYEGRIIADRILDAYRRGIPYSEMAIFYRIHALSRSIERELIGGGIPYTVVRGTEFFRRAEVLDLLAYLKVLVNPRDGETLLRVLNVPARGIGDTTRARLLASAHERDASLLEVVLSADSVPGLNSRAKTNVRNLGKLLEELAAIRDGPVAATIKTIVSLTGYGSFLKTRYPENHEDRAENVSELVSSAAEYDAREDPRGLVGYLEEVSLLSDADRTDLEAARVSLMTLHTAKGLEYRTVLIAGMEEGLIPHSRSRDSTEELEEERRLLFVGMTRAKEELHLSYAKERFRWGDRGYSRKSPFLDEIDPDAIEGDPLGGAALDDPWSSPRVRETPGAGGSEPTYVVDEFVEPAPGEGLRPGMEVRHDHFGIGRILQVTGAGGDAKVTIDFRDHGRKRIALAFARLRCVDGSGRVDGSGSVGDAPW